MDSSLNFKSHLSLVGSLADLIVCEHFSQATSIHLSVLSSIGWFECCLELLHIKVGIGVHGDELMRRKALAGAFVALKSLAQTKYKSRLPAQPSHWVGFLGQPLWTVVLLGVIVHDVLILLQTVFPFFPRHCPAMAYASSCLVRLE
jgi:hypothetical protein